MKTSAPKIKPLKEGDRVKILKSAPRCASHKGQIGTIEKIRHAHGIGNSVYFVRFSDTRCELHRGQDLQRMS